jgi:hypothetical protein
MKNMAMLGGLLFAVIDSPKKTPIKYRTDVKLIQTALFELRRLFRQQNRQLAHSRSTTG